MAAAQVMSGQSDIVIGGGVESMSRIEMFSSGGALVSTLILPCRIISFRREFRRSDRTIHGYSARTSTATRRKSETRGYGLVGSRFARSVVPVRDDNDIVILDRDEHLRPETTMQTLGALERPSLCRARSSASMPLRLQRYAQVERVDHVHTPAIHQGS